MWELLKDYLENKNCSYRNVDIVSFDENGHECNVEFKHEKSIYNQTVIEVVNLWDVLAYVNSKL